ncbi:MAG: PD40 domain-containing protein [Bacteroidaceae bacterium]|nr:PD40 domain-containing protein [Bacteroidaceae bacterium]
MKTIRLICLLATLCLLAACSQSGSISRTDNHVADIYPDYRDVTIPCNIAPLNFSVCDSTADGYALQIEAAGQTLWTNADGGDFCIDKDEWKDALETLTKGGKSGKMTLTIARRINGEWVGGKPFTMTVMPDSIDDYITYRLIPPGYSGWYRMGIYQQQLSTSEESCIFENSHTQGNCVNCHTVGSQRADRTLFHMRTSCAGTYIFRNNTIERLSTKTDSTMSAFVYPSWHPSGRFIAFSTNDTSQEFHTAHKDRIEVFDRASDVLVYDADTREAILSPLLRDSLNMQTFPTFSPDGKWLYYCSAPRIEDVGLNYKDVHYSLCRIAFDAEKGCFGDKADTIYNARTGITDQSGNTILKGRSVSFPRISPDGRWLVCTIHNYGTFSIWHSDADLYMIDLQRPDTIRSMKAANSDDVESYHSWSSNSRWMVFSSRRDDGLYTRPYFTYIDKDGNARKPFMLPQENPRKHYRQLDYSYNIPEFMTSRFNVPMREILNAAKQDSIPVGIKGR